MLARIFSTLAVVASLVASALILPRPAHAQGGTALPLYTPIPLNVPTIAPSVIPTLPPASKALQIPYPALGTPAPNVTASYVDATVPQTVNLRQAILIGIARSPLLASARGDVQVARGNVTLARVPILPNLGATAATTRSGRQAGAGSTPNPSSTAASFSSSIASEVTSNSLTADLRQLIFDGGKTYAAIKAASSSQNAAITTYQRQLQTVVFDVASAYYNALLAMRTTAVDNDLVTAQKAYGA